MGTRRVGHAGTLDPLAEGVLPLALGRATRLIDRLADADKEYYAEVVLGLRTSTDDAEGDILDRVALPTFGLDELAAGAKRVRRADRAAPAGLLGAAKSPGGAPMTWPGPDRA